MSARSALRFSCRLARWTCVCALFTCSFTCSFACSDGDDDDHAPSPMSAPDARTGSAGEPGAGSGGSGGSSGSSATGGDGGPADAGPSDPPDGGPGASCPTQCERDALRCTGARIERCSPGADGCLRYASERDCSDDGQQCVQSEDGASCAPPTPRCDDGVQNGDESDRDCGGACAPCAEVAA